ncbi:MAG TPA: hypothetical protein VFU43_18705 [Streptosporangiaceae bacterium]|nr:hypothetical protein [Streptosporangiaceae bacterium]
MGPDKRRQRDSEAFYAWMEQEQATVTTPDPDAWYNSFKRDTDNIQTVRLEAERVLGELEDLQTRRDARGSATERQLADKYPQLKSRTNTTE